MDGDCTFRNFKYGNVYADQPWIDLQIYRVIRSKWVELRNAEIDSSISKGKKSKK